ncbi:hypothetical protein TNCV_5116521 [Trichonephila clavipes]|nr:hypothetical protein TNCV_5116521 [Trichonephila clavipes]
MVKVSLLIAGRNKSSPARQASPYLYPVRIFRKKSVCVIDREISAFLHNFPEESRETRTRKNGRQHDRQVTNLVTKYDANLALSPRFRRVLIESPL